MPDAARTDLPTIARLRVPGRDGLVPLDSSRDAGGRAAVRSQIDRYDRSRNVTISADLGGTPLGEAIGAVEQLPSIRNLPPERAVAAYRATPR